MWTPFGEEQQQFRQLVRRFVSEELLPHVDAWEEQGCFPTSVFKRAGQLGIHGAHYPVAHGGGGGDYWFSVAKAEEYARCRSAGVAMGLLVQSDMATPVISDLGSEQQIAEFLVPALAGDRVAALGISEPGAGSDVARIETQARRDGDDYLLSGQKTFITNGTRADFVTMLAKTDPDKGAHGCSFFLVPTSSAGFSVSRKLAKIGNHASDTAELFLDEVRIPSRNLLGQEGMGFMYLMQNFQSERLIASAGALQTAFLALDEAIAYGRERVAFGKPLIKRELWRDRFVDLFARCEAARSLVYRCVDGYVSDRAAPGGQLGLETVRLISMAKVLVGDVLSDTMDSCLQFHGGWGYLEEYPIARAWRDQRLFRIGGGSSETLKYYLAKLMGW